MKFIRWLLSNIILIAFILALTYAYVYWDNLTGPDTPAGKAIAVLSDEFESVREFVESYQPDTEVAEEPAAALPETVVAEQQEAAPPRDEPAAPPIPPQPPPATPVRQSAPPVRQSEPPPTAPQPPVAPVRRPEPPVRQPAPPVSQPAPPVAPAKPESKSTTGPTDQRLWIAARTAFQNGQYQESIRLYREVIAANSESFDAWGELGNVYLRTGEPAQAGAAYYEAAVSMVRQGQSARARSVLPLLHRLDRDKATQLNELLLRPAGRGGE